MALSPGLTFNFAGNDPSGLMGNAKIRKAISYCIDREEMVSRWVLSASQ